MKFILRLISVLILLMGVVMGYIYLTRPKMPQTSASAALKTPDKPAAAGVTVVATGAVVAPSAKDILIIKVGGSISGVVKIALNRKVAPKSVARIEALAISGAYNNVVFHRVIDGFMAQTGDVKYGKRGGDLSKAGMGGSDKPDLKAEFSKLPFVRGAVGMARSNSPDSANSQFFIMFASAPYLDGKYTVVGKVVSGMNVVDRIKKGSATRNGAVTKPDYMETVTVQNPG